MKSPGSNLTRNFSGDFNNASEVTFSYHPGVVPYISHIGMCRPKGCGFWVLVSVLLLNQSNLPKAQHKNKETVKETVKCILMYS